MTIAIAPQRWLRWDLGEFFAVLEAAGGTRRAGISATEPFEQPGDVVGAFGAGKVGKVVTTR